MLYVNWCYEILINNFSSILFNTLFETNILKKKFVTAWLQGFFAFTFTVFNTLKTNSLKLKFCISPNVHDWKLLKEKLYCYMIYLIWTVFQCLFLMKKSIYLNSPMMRRRRSTRAFDQYYCQWWFRCRDIYLSQVNH